MDSYDEDVFVVGAVEDGDDARFRRVRMKAPKKIVSKLDGRRNLERDYSTAEWIDGAEDAADRAVFARGVDALQDDEQAGLLRRIKQLLQLAELLGELRESCFGLRFGESARRVRIDFPEVDPGVRRDLDRNRLLRHCPALSPSTESRDPSTTKDSRAHSMSGPGVLCASLSAGAM